MCLQQQFNIFISWVFYDIRFSPRSIFKEVWRLSNVLWRLCGPKLNYKLIKSENEGSSLNLIIFMQKFLFGAGRAMWSVREGVMPVHASHQSVWVVLNNESNCLLENRMVSTLIWRCISYCSLFSQTFYTLYRGRITYEKYFVWRSAAYNAHAVSKMPNTQLWFEGSFWTG